MAAPHAGGQPAALHAQRWHVQAQLTTSMLECAEHVNTPAGALAYVGMMKSFKGVLAFDQKLNRARMDALTKRLSDEKTAAQHEAAAARLEAAAARQAADTVRGKLAEADRQLAALTRQLQELQAKQAAAPPAKKARTCAPAALAAGALTTPQA